LFLRHRATFMLTPFALPAAATRTATFATAPLPARRPHHRHTPHHTNRRCARALPSVLYNAPPAVLAFTWISRTDTRLARPPASVEPDGFHRNTGTGS